MTDNDNAYIVDAAYLYETHDDDDAGMFHMRVCTHMNVPRLLIVNFYILHYLFFKYLNHVQ